MDTSANAKSANKGFTLVEMLVVITIIGILMGLLVAAVVRARGPVRNAVIKSEIDQLDMALTNCKTQFTQLPPDFTDTNAVDLFIRKAFPKYKFTPTPQDLANNPSDFVPGPPYYPHLQMLKDLSHPPNHPRRPGYGLIELDPADPNALSRLDPASALLFWLGGLPETPPAAGGQWVPAGFHSDPMLPFKPGGPRIDPLFDFAPERVVVREPHPDDPTQVRYFRYYPEGVEAPYVYFRAFRYGGAWGYAATAGQVGYQHSAGDPADPTDDNICVPYVDPQNPPGWRNHDTCQVIAAGLDGQFGWKDFTVLRVSKTGLNFTQGDFDNLANFSKGKLEDEMQ